MKYAMIPINRKYDSRWNRLVRRILISYTKKVDGVYTGCKVIAKDPYFDNPNSSQQYVFEDNQFYLIKDAYEDVIQQDLINVKRNYEYDSGLLSDTAIEFNSSSDALAIKKFNNRKEKH